MVSAARSGRTGRRTAATSGGIPSICAKATHYGPDCQRNRTRTRRSLVTSLKGMPKLTRYANLGAVVLPFIAFVVAVVLLWNKSVDAIDLTILVVMYSVTGFGITVGYHRLLTHRAFQTSKPVEYAFAIAGCMALEGPPIAWVADHRLHHAHTDDEGDPHSPHVGHGSGALGALARARRLAVEDAGLAEFRKYAPTSSRTGMRGSVALPALAAWPRIPSPSASRCRHRSGALSTCWGGLVRSSSTTTSRGRSTASATSSAAGASPSRITPPTSSGSRSVVGRGLAPQSSRLPALRLPGPGPLRGRSVGDAHLVDGEGRHRDERRAHHARAQARSSSPPSPPRRRRPPDRGARLIAPQRSGSVAARWAPGMTTAAESSSS